jgi:type IV pilus assembly protein PilZ
MEKNNLSLPPETAALREEGSVFLINIPDKEHLFQLYMPFLMHGGLFVKTDKPCHLGDEVFLLVKLMDEPEKIKAHGKVAWITPLYAQEGRQAGIGVQFIEENSTLRVKIETYLAGGLLADRSTDTL